MAGSLLLLAKRALVALIRSVAVAYGVHVTCNRDSDEAAIIANFRKVALRAHPDRGGSTTDQQRLNDARQAWDEARKKNATAGRPKRDAQTKPSSKEDHPIGLVTNRDTTLKIPLGGLAHYF